MAGNRFLTQMLDVLDDQIQSFLQKHARDHASRTRALETHRDIFKRIEQQDTRTIGALTRSHIKGCKRSFEAATTKQKETS